MTTLIVGGGVSGLAFAGFLHDQSECLLIEKDDELGGDCRTIYQDGFTWDYSGHFFHFRNKWIADRLHSTMDEEDLVRVDRKARIFLEGRYIDYPFQYNIHQLSLSSFSLCLRDMYMASSNQQKNFSSFRDLVFGRYGKAMSELFFIPYNEKLYSLPCEQLHPEAMGRFLPHIEFAELLDRITANQSTSSAPGYNAQFSYHRMGARAYVDALASFVDASVLRTNTSCQRIDLDNKRALVGDDWIKYERLIISAPLTHILDLANVSYCRELLSANKVLVFNIGFDRPSYKPDHWVYYPQPQFSFFRIGHYDNILGTDRMSLYVEVAFPQTASVDAERMFEKVLTDLRLAGVVSDHQVISWCSVMLDPAYIHITPNGQVYTTNYISELERRDVYPIGRYGRWQYCSIEDNILDAYRLAQSLGLGSD